MTLEAKDVGVRYGKEAWLLRGVNLRIEPGEIVGLFGRSGIGKTTLARILAGYIRPQEGIVTLCGKPLPDNGYHPVQLVFQHPETSVNPRWRMRQVLNEGWSPDEAILDSLGIRKEWLHRRPNELSGGELQRFCVARALGPNTQFLIADEMTAMLDAVTQAQIWRAVLQQAEKRRIGLLVISHEQVLLHRLCSRIVDLAAAGMRSSN